MPTFEEMLNRTITAEKYMAEMDNKEKVKRTEMALDDLLLNQMGMFALRSHDDILCCDVGTSSGRGGYNFFSLYINGKEYNTRPMKLGGLDVYYIRETQDLFFRGRDYMVRYQDITAELMTAMRGEPLLAEQEDALADIVRLRNLKDNIPHFLETKVTFKEQIMFFNGKIVEAKAVRDFSKSPQLGIGLLCLTADKEIYFEKLKDKKVYHLLTNSKDRNTEIMRILNNCGSASVSVSDTLGMKMINGQMLFRPETKTLYLADVISNLYVDAKTKTLTLTRDSWIGVWVEDKILDYNLETGEFFNSDCSGGDLDIFQVSFEAVDRSMSEIISEYMEQITKEDYWKNRNSDDDY